MQRDAAFLRAWTEPPGQAAGVDEDASDSAATRHRYRSVWISDLHLGTPGCQAHALLDFLKHVESALSKYLKLKVKRAVSYVGDFEAAVAREARKRGVQGVVCGHIHHAELREIDGITYANDGDWVESLSALVEHADGRLEVIDWSGRASCSGSSVAALPVAPVEIEAA